MSFRIVSRVASRSLRRVLAGAAVALSSTLAQPADCEQVGGRLTPHQAEKFHLTRMACSSPASFGSDTALQRPPREHALQLALYDQAPAPEPIAPASRARPTPIAAPVRLPPTRPAAAAAASRRKPALSGAAQRAVALSTEIDVVALRHDIDPLFLHSIAHVESRHDALATSRVGAMGLMQVMPATARRFGVSAAERLRDARTNLEVSASYLKLLQRRFGNDLDLVLAGYNAGEGAVERYGRSIPPYAETRDYVVKVRSHYQSLRAASLATKQDAADGGAAAGGVQ